VRSGRIRPPDVVKIDVEGAELAVLGGMGSTLAERRPTVICEVDGETPELVAGKRKEIAALLEAAGYTVETLAPSYAASPWKVEHLLARPGAR
jgi:Methyltransferase FkbM domain